MNQKTTIQIFCQINPSEDPEKVKLAVNNVFPDIELEVSDFNITGKTNDIQILSQISKSIHEKIQNKEYPVKKLATENKELYGSVKPTEIAKILNEVEKIDINPSLIQPVKEIKSIGSFKVILNLHSEVQAQISIKVISEDNK